VLTKNYHDVQFCTSFTKLLQIKGYNPRFFRKFRHFFDLFLTLGFPCEGLRQSPRRTCQTMSARLCTFVCTFVARLARLCIICPFFDLFLTLFAKVFRHFFRKAWKGGPKSPANRCGSDLRTVLLTKLSCSGLSPTLALFLASFWPPFGVLFDPLFGPLFGPVFDPLFGPVLGLFLTLFSTPFRHGFWTFS